MLPVGQALLEGTSQLRAGPGILFRRRGIDKVRNGPPEEQRNNLQRRHLAWTHLQAVRQGGKLRPTVLAQAQRLLLGFGVFGPGQAQRRGEEEAGLQAPVGWVLGAQRRGDGGRGDGLGTLDEPTRLFT